MANIPGFMMLPLLAANMHLLEPQVANAAPQDRVDRYGDPLPVGAIARLGTTRLQIGSVTGLACSADGATVMSASRDGSIRLWARATARQGGGWVGGAASYVAFSADGRMVAAGMSADYAIRVYESDTGREVRRLQGHQAWVTGLAFSPDGRVLASGSRDKTLRLWDVAEGKERLRLQDSEGDVSCVAFAPDGTTLASGNGKGCVRLWEAAAGREAGKLEGCGAYVGAVAYSPDGSTLAAGSQTIVVWNLKTGRLLFRLEGHTNGVTSIRFAPDGRTLASSSADGTLRIWESKTGRELRKLVPEQEGGTGCIAFSGDGKILASGHDGAVCVWSVEAGKEVERLPSQKVMQGHVHGVTSVVFSPDGKTVVSGGWDATLRLWDVATGTQVRAIPQPVEECRRCVEKELHHCVLYTTVFHVAFTPDGRRFAVGGGDSVIRVSDAVTGKQLLDLKGHTNRITCLAFGSDGNTLASGSYDKTVRLWDVASKSERLKIDGRGVVWCASFSPDGRTLAAGGGTLVFPNEPRLSLIEAATGRVRLRLDDGRKDEEWVGHLLFTAGGNRIASVSRDHTVRIRESETGKEVASLDGGPFRNLVPAVLSPDGKMLASVMLDERTIRVREIPTGKLLVKFRGHADEVECLAFSPDGRLVASGGRDGTVLVWSVGESLRLPQCSPQPLTPEERARLWEDLASSEPTKLFASSEVLSEEDPQGAIELFRTRLESEARASRDEISCLIGRLEEDDPEVRERASARLLELDAEEPVRRAIREDQAGETRARLGGLLQEMERRANDPARMVSTQGEQSRRIWVSGLLQKIGTREAVRLLEWLSAESPWGYAQRSAKFTLEEMQNGRPK